MLLTSDELKALSQRGEEPFISIFMPTRQAGPETRENSIRFKNLVKQAETQLVEKGFRTPEVREILKPLQDLINDHDFWQHQDEGLAVFLSPNLFRTYRLPLAFEELLITGDRFHLKPLMPLLSNDGLFYLLALSQGEIRLFEATRYTIQEIELEDMPKSQAEALQYDEPLKQLQFHTQTSGPASSTLRSAMFHGHGVGTDEAKTNNLRFLQKVDAGLRRYLKGEKPLVLIGVEYLLPIYQEANTYPYLISEGITGNPDDVKPEQLHEQAWPVIQPYFERTKQEAMAQYETLVHQGLASGDISQIVPAAHYGKIEKLFVAVDFQQWGQFDPDTNTLQLHDEPQAGDEDLLDLAAIQTLLNGGVVYAMEFMNVPGDTPVAAVFRY
jgi:hypothetical protein